MRARTLLAALVTLGASGVGGSAVAQSIDTLAIRAHTRFLADDLLAGRGTGTAGERIAAAYIESQLIRLGLQPLPGHAYLLPVPFAEVTISPSATVTLSGDVGDRTFLHGAHFIVNTGGAASFRSFDGPALLAGDPATALPRIRAAPVDGRTIVFLGPLGAAAAELVPELRSRNVAGIVLLVPDAAQYDLYVRSRGLSRLYVDGPVNDPVWQPQIPVLIAGPDLTFALLGADPAARVNAAATAAVPLGASVDARLPGVTAALPAHNVAGFIPGTDPALKDEWVVYTAHYDHLGISTPVAGDSIYNGFSDNAAGVAMLLAIAAALAEQPPARSVAFLFFTGEERGLLGSTWFVTDPPIPLALIAGLINLDAGAPPAPPASWRIAGSDNAVSRLAREVAGRSGWEVVTSPASPNSDYWPFHAVGVPSIFIIPGERWEDTTTAQRDALRARWDRYHQAGDHWDPAFPFRGLERYARFALMVGLRLARP